MKKSRYTDRQILAILKQNKVGAKVADLCREHAMSEATSTNGALNSGVWTLRS
jgi:putative transposase